MSKKTKSRSKKTPEQFESEYNEKFRQILIEYYEEDMKLAKAFAILYGICNSAVLVALLFANITDFGYFLIGSVFLINYWLMWVVLGDYRASETQLNLTKERRYD